MKTRGGTTGRVKGAPTFAKCACTGANLPKLVHAMVLALLADRPMHGYAIMDAIAGLRVFGENPPDHSGIYRLLRGMEKAGFVKPRRAVAVSGRRKRDYALTASGRQCLLRWVESLVRYRAAVETVLRLCRSR